jgi:hypothetical protein
VTIKTLATKGFARREIAQQLSAPKAHLCQLACGATAYYNRSRELATLESRSPGADRRKDAFDSKRPHGAQDGPVRWPE